ncbi:uncharacterized protein LOC124552668 [Schistocerca americana]|uniref:uncharacterized protein LOC124552668 n=1 Tax=Schistocerca americana TaxID=7009 RepID=UPI001F4FFF88|nr:uncharacterized protein LOC124552668 [Schistocerca americana]
MELVVTLPAEVFRCRICFVTKAAGRPTFGEYKDHSALLRHYRRLHDPETVPIFGCLFCGRRDPRLKMLRAHLRFCNAESATPGAASRGRASATPRTAVVATPASCVLCVRTPRRSGIPLPTRSATSTAPPRVPSASSGGEGSTLPTPAAERVAPARGAVSGKSRGSPLPAPAIAPSGIRWPRRAAAADASRPPSVGSVGTGLGLPPAFATPPTGDSVMRVGSGRRFASLAAADADHRFRTDGALYRPVRVTEARRELHLVFLAPAAGRWRPPGHLLAAWRTTGAVRLTRAPSHQQQRTAARAAPTLLPIPLPLPLHAAAVGSAVDVVHGARRPPSVGTTRVQRQIQKLYRADQRKAMQHVLGETSPYCQINGNVLTEHFRKTYTKSDFYVSDAPAAVPDFAATTPPDVSEEVLPPITPSEVQQRLQKASNTAPGADGVTHSDLRREYPGCHVLARIFSRCWNERKTPVQWKVSTTVLIHKKGDVSDVMNWQPLALSSTVSKLFAAIVADRTTLWAERLNPLSPEQKGLRTFEGCYEHNFIVQTAIDDARRRGGQACFAWLDLANAFGSVPHAHLLGVLSGMGLPEQLHHLIADMYNGCSTRVRTSDGGD